MFVAELVSYVLNKSLETGICPIHFKIGDIVPLHKVGDKDHTCNYRPIMLISNWQKYMKKL